MSGSDNPNDPDRDWSSTADAVALGDPGDSFGPVPGPTRIPRWFSLAGPPEERPSIRATCRRVTTPLVVDGRLDDAAWASAEWSDPFVTIETGGATPLESRIALLWDDDHLYAGYAFEDPDPQAISREWHSWVFLTDPDAELFVAGPEAYVECGINPLGTVYESRWEWLEPLIERRDHAAIERLFKVPNGLYYTARPGERSGRLADLDWEVAGARYAATTGPVRLPGREPVMGWSAEFALPWSGLASILGSDRAPAPGSSLKVQAYRAHHDRSDPERTAAMAALWGPGASPFVGWTWAPQGNANVHNPECWVELTLVD